MEIWSAVMGDKAEEADNAFDWFILLISTISGIIIGLPTTSEGKRIVIGAAIPPFFILVLVWLLSRFVKGPRKKLVLKMYAWFQALAMVVFFIWVFVEIIYGLLRMLHSRVFMPFPFLAIPWVALWFLGPFIFFDQLICPVYKEAYADSKILASRKRLFLLYVLAFATTLFLMLPFLSSAQYGGPLVPG